MSRPALAVLLALAAGPAWGQTDKFSAQRDKEESFAHAREEFWQKVGVPYSPTGPGAEQSAVPLDRLDLSQVPAWPDRAALDSAFAGLRDARPLRHPQDFARRLTWLYPDDGCFARAALMADLAQARSLPRPRKLFVFGELEARTPNTPQGTVSWWYHVAPIVSVGGAAFVLDPALEPARALGLQEWVERMQLRSRALRVAVCGEHAYTPDSPCRGAAPGTDSIAGKNMNEYLPREWARVEALGMKPALVLGDSPPWAVAAAPGRSVLPSPGSGAALEGRMKELATGLQGSTP